jgi:two-component system NtrC family sensor kinase
MVGYTKDFHSVRVTLRDLDSPRVVAGDPGRLEQVFINLFVNAARAMKGEGEITVSARDLGAAPGADDKPGVELSVEDTGPGIPEGLIDKIFDPFFTTGDGTGLGLAISYSIISASGGSITASNREGGGARFTLILPNSELAVVSRSGERSEA